MTCPTSSNSLPTRFRSSGSNPRNHSNNSARIRPFPRAHSILPRPAVFDHLHFCRYKNCLPTRPTCATPAGMKSLPFALCLVALCAFASDSPSAEHGSQNGRYRLLRATVSVAAFGKSDTAFDQQCVLKIDSATGRTWLLMYGINLSDPHKSVCNFSEIPDGGFVVKSTGPLHESK